MFESLRKLNAKHEALKKKIHAFRLPLPKWGVTVMKFVYFSIPLVFGYYCMQWTNSIAQRNFENAKDTLVERYKHDPAFAKEWDAAVSRNKELQVTLDEIRLKKEEMERSKKE